MILVVSEALRNEPIFSTSLPPTSVFSRFQAASRKLANSIHGNATTWSVLFDTLVVLSLLAIRWQAQVRQIPGLEQTADLPAWWWNWGSLPDWLLHPGPDAGLWAENARVLAEGHALDFNRLPVYLYLLAMAGEACGDLVFGGHLLNHGLSALLPLGIYALGRATSGRAVAVGAGCLTALSPTLVAHKGLFGVDPCVHLILLLLATATWWARNGSMIRIVSTGVLAGVAVTTHYLCVLFVPFSLLLLLATDRRRNKKHRYLLSPLVATLVAGCTVLILMRPYANFSPKLVPMIVAEGLRSFGFSGSDTPLFTVFWNILLQSPHAVETTLQAMLVSLLGSGLPWGVLVVLFYLGIVGPGLREGKGRFGDLRPCLWMICFLGPLVALETVNAPLRYRLYAQPFIYLVIMRGVAVVAIYMSASIRHRILWWPKHLLSAVFVGVLVLRAWAPMQEQWAKPGPTQGLVAPIQQRGLLEREFGQYVADTGRPLVSRSPEIRFFSRAPLCILTTTPNTPTMAPGDLLAAQVSACGGQVAYIVEDLREQGLGDSRLQGADTYVMEHFEPTHQKSARDYRVSLFLLDSPLPEAAIESSEN